VPDAPPDFLAAFTAGWKANGTLVAAVRGPFLGQAPADVEPPYAILNMPASRTVNRDTTGTRQVQSVYEVAVFDYDPDTARDLGKTEVPEFRSGGSKTIWRQLYSYQVNVVHPPRGS
jgi:hypothetical protein